MGFGCAGQRRPHLVAPGKMPPFIGMTGKAFFRHQPVQQAAIGARFLIGKRKILRSRCSNRSRWASACHVIEQRAHPELFAALPAQGEIDRRRPWHGARANFRICGRRGPIAFHFLGQGSRRTERDRGAEVRAASRHHGNRPAPRAAARHRTETVPVPPPLRAHSHAQVFRHAPAQPELVGGAFHPVPIGRVLGAGIEIFARKPRLARLHHGFAEQRVVAAGLGCACEIPCGPRARAPVRRWGDCAILPGHRRPTSALE